MQSIEQRIELTDQMIQELLWRALLPDGHVHMPTFNKALNEASSAMGEPPANSQIEGISVTIERDRVYAEITYTTLEA